MGFFSWNCNGCNKSIRSQYSISEDTEWMKRAVVIFPNGSRIIGEYDGYGRINDHDFYEAHGFNYETKFSMWHEKCWEESGHPEFTEPATNAEDQGYFIED